MTPRRGPNSKVPGVVIAPTPPILRPGRGYQAWMRMFLWPLFLVAIPAGVVGVITAVILAINDSISWISTLAYVCITVFMAVMCWVLVVMVAALPSRGRERRAGYTTGFAVPHASSLWQLDYKTGEVMRRPGDPAISINQWRRLQAAGGRYTDAELMSAVKGKPGWYPDYRNHGAMTWWDGDQWTQYTA